MDCKMEIFMIMWHRIKYLYREEVGVTYLAGGAGLDEQASLRGWSSSGGRLIFGEELDWNKLAPGDEKNKRFDCDGEEGFKLPCSSIDGDIERASKLKHLKSLMGLGEREYWVREIEIICNKVNFSAAAVQTHYKLSIFL